MSAEDPTPAEVREIALKHGQEIRDEVAKLPESDDRTRFLSLSDQMARFWVNASDAFLSEWLVLSVEVAVRDARRGMRP